MRRLIRFLHGGPSFIRDIQDLDQVGLGQKMAKVMVVILDLISPDITDVCRPSDHPLTFFWTPAESLGCATQSAAQSAAALWKHPIYTQQIAVPAISSNF